MNRHSTEFKALIDQLAAGTLTRAEAAERSGVKLNTLNAWISRANLAGTLKPAPRRYRGDAHHAAEKDPEKRSAWDEAVAKVLAGESSARKIAGEMNLSERTVALKVRQARQKAGMPVRSRAAST